MTSLHNDILERYTVDNFTYMNVQRNGLQVTALDRNLVKL